MAARIGRCANELFCSIASAGEDVLVREGEAFVCPKCGKPLFDAPARQSRAPQRAALIGVAVVTLAAGGFIIGRGLVVTPPAQTAATPPSIRPTPAALVAVPPSRPAQTASAAAAPALATPPAAMAAPPPMAPPPAQPMPQPAANVAVAAPAPQQTAMLAPPPMAPVAAPLRPQPVPSVVTAAPAPPPASPATRPAPQKVALLTPARPAADKLPTAATKVPVPPPGSRNTLAASRQTSATAAPPAPPKIVAPVPPPKTQVALATPTPPPAPLPPRPAEPAAPRGEDRPFHASPVAGGGPSYPRAYEEEGRAGSVTISCTIQTSGFPSGCRVVSVDGGSAFSGAVMKWVSSGRVRFAPILRNGQPVAETHQWAVSFAAP